MLKELSHLPVVITIFLTTLLLLLPHPHMNDQSLTESQTMFRDVPVDLAISVFPIPVWIFSRETLKILEVNRAAELAYGYSRSEFLELTIVDIRPEAEKEKLLQYVSQPDLPPEAGVWMHQTKSGQLIYAQIYAREIEFLDQACRIVTANNITDVVLARQALLSSQHELELKNEELLSTQRQLIEQQRRLENILEGTHVGTWEWNIETGWTSFSERWAQIIGYSIAELEPVSINTWLEYCHPDDLVHSNDLLQRHFSRQTDFYQCEVRMRHRNGDWIWVLARGKVHEWTMDQQPRKMAGTHQDITLQKLASERLAESELRFKSMADHSPSVIWMTDAENRTSYLSKEWYKFTGSSLSKQLDTVWMDSVHPHDRDRVLQEWLMHANKRERFSIDYRLRKHDGTYEWFADSGIPRYTGDTFVGYIGTCMNQHARKQYEERLVHALKEKEVLIREIHHRVKNNLQLISSLMFMKSEANPTAEVEEMMRYVRLHISSVSLIYEKLLQNNSIDQVSLDTYLSSLVHEIAKGFQRKELQLTIKQDYDKIYVDHDTSTFCGLVVNELMTNAYKHAFPHQPSGILMLEVKSSGDDIELSLSDNGVGLRQPLVEKNKSHGLQLIQLMLKQLKGSMTIETEWGTRFILRFPLPNIRD